MSRSCPYCISESEISPASPRLVRFGSFRRKSDGRFISRFRCLNCKKTFSLATTHSCFGQNKRQFNEPIRKLLCSGVSLRRTAMILNLSRTTVARKLIFLGERARAQFDQARSTKSYFHKIEFDDMETSEHTKCKPISITLAVESKTRQILGYNLARMPAKGKLAKIALKKYGKRIDERSRKRRELFQKLSHIVDPQCEIRSDQNPHYPKDVCEYFPLARHITFKGHRGCVVGQGELKRGGFDPLFSLNHTCAMLRANINRLFRRTWCTTKKIDRLADHIALYVNFHNQLILKK